MLLRSWKARVGFEDGGFTVPRLMRFLPLAQPVTVILDEAVLSATTMESPFSDHGSSTGLAALSLSYMPGNSQAHVTFSRLAPLVQTMHPPRARPGFLRASLRGCKHCTCAVLCGWLGLVIWSLLYGMTRLASTQGLFQPQAPDAPDAPTKTCYCHFQNL